MLCVTGGVKVSRERERERGGGMSSWEGREEGEGVALNFDQSCIRLIAQEVTG